jgi:hypothetical protein
MYKNCEFFEDYYLIETNSKIKDKILYINNKAYYVIAAKNNGLFVKLKENKI